MYFKWSTINNWLNSQQIPRQRTVRGPVYFEFNSEESAAEWGMSLIWHNYISSLDTPCLLYLNLRYAYIVF